MRFLLPLAAVAALAMAATPASAQDHRTPHDPCAKHGNGKSINDEGSNGVLHCGAVFQLRPGHHPEGLFAGGAHHAPDWARPDDCEGDTLIKGTENRIHGVHDEHYRPHWFFAPLHGQWVTWVPQQPADFVKEVRMRDRYNNIVTGAKNLTPKFFNHSTVHDWPMRYFFYCTPR
jgi:hypothetical protein